MGPAFGRANAGLLSPEGRWLACYSNESTRSEIYVRPLYGPGRRQQVSRNGGARPRWSRDGDERFFAQDVGVGGEILMAATLERGDDIRELRVDSLFPMAVQNFDCSAR